MLHRQNGNLLEVESYNAPKNTLNEKVYLVLFQIVLLTDFFQFYAQHIYF